MICLNKFKPAGPAELHSVVLKEQAKGICELLPKLFTKSWETGRIPEEWKRAIVSFLKKAKRMSYGIIDPLALLQYSGSYWNIEESPFTSIWN